MASSYPNSLDSFSNPAGTSTLAAAGHAALHSEERDAIESLEAKVGVGSGTPVANRAFIGSGNGTSGWTTTWNNATLGTPAITGGTVASSTINNSTLGTPAVVLGSDAQGDVYYRNATTLTRLGAGTGGQVLRTGGAAANPTWVTPSKAYAGTPTAGQTTTNTSFEDMAAGTVSVVLDVKSNVFVNAYTTAANSGAGAYSYIQMVYDNGGNVIIGLDQYLQSSGANTEGNIVTGGIVSGLAAGTYNFKMQKRTSANTSTFQRNFISILVVPSI